MNKRIFFCILGGIAIASSFSFVQYVAAAVPGLSINHDLRTVQVNQDVEFWLDVVPDISDGCGWNLIGIIDPPPYNRLIIDFGDGTLEEWGCIPPGHRPHTCRATASHSYNAPGTYQVRTTARYAGTEPGCDEWRIVYDSIEIIDTICISDGCNAVCPAGCTVTDDPDCGCKDGDGCCGIGCNNTNDNDCLSGPGVPTKYDNPLLAENIIQFIGQMIVLFFTASLYFAVLMILVGAYFIITSNNIPTRVTKGKKIIMWTLIAVAILLTSRGIIELVWMLLGKK